MCHCFSELTEMSDEERAEVVDEHSTEELRSVFVAHFGQFTETVTHCNCILGLQLQNAC